MGETGETSGEESGEESGEVRCAENGECETRETCETCDLAVPSWTVSESTVS